MALNRNGTPRGKPVFRKEDCSPFDIGVLFNEISSFSDTRKLEVIEKVWSPRSDPFVFPRTIESGGRSRKFNQAWLQQFPRLGYFKFLDGAFCFPCVLFARECGRNAGRLDKLVKTPITFWTTAMRSFARHSNGRCQVHNLAVIATNNFVRTMRQQIVPIDQQPVASTNRKEP